MNLPPLELHIPAWGIALRWLHDLSLSALAAAVLCLGVVMLLQLRSLAQLRRSVDASLARVFEQLDLLRFETHQLLEGQSQPLAAQALQRPVPPRIEQVTTKQAQAPQSAPPELAPRTTLAAGEARLLASIAQARARRAEAARSTASASAS